MKQKIAHHTSVLEASRRIDWRFLLPQPELGQVAYFGHDDVALLEALSLFSTSLSHRGEFTNVSQERSHSYDIAVLVHPLPDEVFAAAELVRPGGWLYIEADGILASPLRRRPRAFFGPRYLRLIQRLALDEEEIYWHWPRFSGCEEIVPLKPLSAVRYMLNRRQGDVATRLQASIARLLAEVGLLAWIAPSVSVLARIPEGAKHEL